MRNISEKRLQINNKFVSLQRESKINSKIRNYKRYIIDKMSNLIKPEGYKALLDMRQTEMGIKMIKEFFQQNLSTELRLRRVQLDNGGMYTALDENEKVVGMAFALPLEAGTAPSDKKLFIKELLYDSEEIKELLLQELTLQNNISQATVNTPPTPPGTLPMGMARIIDTKRMIHLWLSKQHESPVSKKDLEQMDNQTLTRQLMGYQGRTAYMSLMLD